MVNNNKFIQNCLINSVVLVLSTLLYCERKLFFFLNEQNGQIGPIVTLSKLGKHVVTVVGHLTRFTWHHAGQGCGWWQKKEKED